MVILAASLTNSRGYAGAATDIFGHLYVVGGYAGSTGALASTETLSLNRQTLAGSGLATVADASLGVLTVTPPGAEKPVMLPLAPTTR